MGQLNFQMNFPYSISQRVQISYDLVSFIGFQVIESISLNTLNFAGDGGTGTGTVKIGLYSITGNTLSIANSISGSFALVSGRYISLTDMSATQNISPGAWYFGFLFSSATDSGSAFSIDGQSGLVVSNAFPGVFIGGAMTATTNALPASYATSDLDVTGANAMIVPEIIISA